MSVPAAVVLCGGESQRMGRPKAWLPFGPEVLLQRVVRGVGSVAGPVVVVAAPGQALPDLPASAVVVRDPVAFRGPLQGIASGLSALPDSTDLVYVTAVDAPFLKPEWVPRLAALIGDHDTAVPRAGGYLHPLAALYRRRTVLPAVSALLAADCLRPTFLAETVRARVVDPQELADIDPNLDTLRNLNTPADYARALRDAGFGSTGSDRVQRVVNMDRGEFDGEVPGE